jgi:hypothetical protein
MSGHLESTRKQSYDQQTIDYKAGYTTTIQDHPTWVVPQDSQSPGAPPVNVVHVSIGDVEVSVLSGMKIDDLVALAGTLQEVNAADGS